MRRYIGYASLILGVVIATLAVVRLGVAWTNPTQLPPLGSGGGMIPSGAVMAFNLANCPTGWSAFTATNGRTVVGIDGSQTEFNALGKTGGEKTHALTVAEMPSHSHGGSVGSGGTHNHSIYGGAAPGLGGGGYRVFEGVSWYDADAGWFHAPTPLNDGAHTHSITAEGGGQAHNVLQPYVTLLYCTKN